MNYKQIRVVLALFFVLLLSGVSLAQSRHPSKVSPAFDVAGTPDSMPLEPPPVEKQYKEIKTIKALVPYEDLYKVLQKDVGKYFILPIEEYEELKAAKEASLKSEKPDKPLPPKAYQIESARFEGKISESFAIINGYFRVETFTDKWHEIPLLTGSLGIKSAKLNGVDSTVKSSGMYQRSARVVNYAVTKSNALQQAISKGTVRRDNLSQKNWKDSVFSIPINGQGTHECRITFMVPIDNQNDIFTMQFGLAPVPLVFMQYSTDDFLMAVENTNFQDYTVTEKDAGTSNFIGWLGASSDMKLSWRRRYARPTSVPEPDAAITKDSDKEGADHTEEVVEEEKPLIIEPLVYARSNTIVTIDETRIIGHKSFEYTISKAAVSSFTFLLPENSEISSVIADRNYSQRQVRDGSERKLIVDFMTGRENSCKIEIAYEAPVDLSKPVIGIPEIKPLNIERELGTIAIEALASVEVQPGNTEANPFKRGIHPLDPVEVPQFLKDKTERTILLAYRHNISPTGVLVAIKRYDDVPQQTIVADSFDVKTTFTTNQTSNTLLNLRIRNNNKQYLYLTLASGSEVVSAFAGNTALNPLTSRDAHKNRVQIPLEMSSTVGQPVEMDLQILVKQPVPELDWRGSMDFEVPLIDIPVSRFNWSLYAPVDYYLFNFNGTVRQTQEPKPPFFFRGFVELMKLAIHILLRPELVFILIFCVFIFLLLAARKILFAIVEGIWNFICGIFAFIFGGGGFRLVELMVVAAIIAALAALSVPNFRKSRGQARQKACQANLRVILGAVEMYNMDQEVPMKDLRLDLLVKNKNLRAMITPPTPDCSYYSTGDLSTDGVLHCRAHGSIENPIDPGESRSFFASKARSDHAGRSRSSEAMMPTAAMPQQEAVAVPVTDSFGAVKTPGMRPIRSRFVVTSNHYSLSRDLVIAKTDEEGALVANSTSPSVRFSYLDSNFIRIGKILAFVIAFFGAIYFVAGSVMQVNSKLWLAALLVVLLSVIDLKLEAYGDSANAGFWLAILMAFIWKTVWLLSQYKDYFSIMPIDSGVDNVSPEPVINNDTTPPDSDFDKSGHASTVVMILTALFLVAVFSFPVFASDVREIRVMAPFQDITKVIPANDRVVIIPETDYEYLRNIVATEEPQTKAPQDYSFESVKYEGTVVDNGVRFKATFRLSLFNDGWKQIELLSRSAIPSYASINGQPLSLSLTNNSYSFMTSETGAREILVDFFVPLSSTEFGHTSNFTLPTLPVGVSLLQIIVNEKDSEIWIDPGILLPANKTGERTTFNAVLPPTSQVNVELYRNMVAAPVVSDKTEEDSVETEKPVVIEEKTRVSISALNLLSLREGFVSGINNFDLRIVGGAGVDSVEFSIPDGYRILKVEGMLVETWNIIENPGDRVLDVLFKSRARGDVKLAIEYEEDAPELTEAPYEVREIVMIGAEQSYGLLGIGCLQSFEVSVDSAPQGYSPIVPPEFLKSWKGEVPEKTPYAFRFLRHPNSLMLTVGRPEDISLQTAVIDKAEAMTLISAEGFVLTRVVYEVRNNSQQFLKVKLPQIGSGTTELWSTQVAGQSVRAGYDEANEVYNLPIIRSPIRNGDSRPFPVEIVYAIHNKAPLRAVQQTYLELPSTHLSISELSWVLYLPDGYELMREDGNLDRIDGQPQIKFLNDPSYFAAAQEMQKRSQRNMQMQQAQQMQAVSNIAESQKQRVFGMAGILPVKFNIPTTSWQTNFSMLQIDPEGKPPHIRGVLVNPRKDRGFLFQLIMILIGVISAIALVRTFVGPKKLRWFVILMVTAVTASFAFYLKLYQADQFAAMGFATTFGMFVFYKFFAHKPSESKDD